MSDGINSTTRTKTFIFFLSFSLILATLNLTSFAIPIAQAAEVIQSIENITLTQVSDNGDNVSLQAVTQGTISDGSTIDLLDSNGIVIETKLATQAVEFIIVKPEIESKVYSVSIGGMVSNSVMVQPLNPILSPPLVPSIQLTTETPSFSTNENTPILNWKTVNSVNDTSSIFIVEEATGYIVSKIAATADTGNVDIERFYTEEYKEYRAYVADINQEATVLNQLANIQTQSDLLRVNRTPWTIELEIDHFSYSTTDETPILKTSVNQNVFLSTAYAYYFVDVTENRIIYSTRGNQSPSLDLSTNVERFFEGGQHDYKSYIAKDGAIDVSGIIDIQAESNIVSTQLSDWTLDLDLNKETFDLTEEMPSFTATSNQNVYKSIAYSYYIVDETTSAIIFADRGYNDTTNHSYTNSIPRFYEGPAHSYKAFIAKIGAVNVEDILDIKAESNSVTASRSEWTVSLAIDQEEFKSGETPILTATANQNVYASNAYEYYYVDLTTNEIIFKSSNYPSYYYPALSTYTGIPSFPQGLPHVYQVYIAKIGATTVGEIEDIQASSNTVSASRLNWTVSLTTDIEEFKNGETPQFVATVNQNVYNSMLYEYYYVDLTTNEIMYKTLGSPSGIYYITPLSTQTSMKKYTEGGPHEYKVYIAARGATSVGELVDIQAESNSITTRRAAWEINLEIQNPVFLTGNYSRLSSMTNQSMAESNYTVYYVDLTTNEIIYQSAGGYYYYGPYAYSETSIKRFYTGGPHEYKVYIAQDGATTVAEMANVQAESNKVVAQRAPWTVNLTTSQEIFQTSYGAYGPSLSATVNQNVAESNGYTYYFVDMTTNEIISETGGYPSNYGNNLTVNVNFKKFFTGGPHTYRVYIAQPGATTVTEITDIQATSNDIIEQRAPWTVSLGITGATFATSSWNSSGTFLTATANQNISESQAYAYYFVDLTTNEIISESAWYSTVAIKRFFTGGPHV